MQSHPPAPEPTAPPQPWWRRTGTFLLLALFAVMVVGGIWWQVAAVQSARAAAQAEHYLSGVKAFAEERWDLAVAEFDAAGNYRDAPQQRMEAARHLNEVEAQYTEALTAWDQGQLWQAAVALHQVVSALPSFRDASNRLTEARRALSPILLFEHQHDEPTKVVLSSPEGGERQLLGEPNLATSGEIASHGRTLVFESVDGNQSDLWLAQIQGDERQLLAENTKDVWARFSPNGEWLSFGRWDQSGWYMGVVPSVGGEPSELLGPTDFVAATFSPDNRTLSFRVREEGRWRIGLVDMATLKLRNMIEDADDIGTLDFSPDGRMVVIGYARNGKFHLTIAAVDGSISYEPAPDAETAWARFSPDGEHILLWVWENRLGRLVLTDLQGNVIREVARGAADVWGEWSSDGQQFAYGSWNGRTWQVTLATRDGDQQTQLTQGADDAQAVFAPKGRWLLLSIWQGTLWQVVLRDLTDGSERLLVGDAQFATALFTPDNEHLLLWYIPAGTEGATLAMADATTGRRIALAENLLAAQGGFSNDGSTLGVALQFATGARPSAYIASADGTTFLEFAPSSYRVYWARTPFLFGPRPPGPPVGSLVED